MSVGESLISGSARSKDVTGVNQVRFPLESRCKPVLIDFPGSRSGRQAPASETSLQGPREGVKGKPPPQSEVFGICQPPTKGSGITPEAPTTCLRLPTGDTYTA